MPERKKFDKLQYKPELNNSLEDTKLIVSASEKKASKPKHTYFFKPSQKEYKKNKVYEVGFIDIFVPFLCAFVLCVINKFLTDAGAYTGLNDTALIVIQCVVSFVTFLIPGIVYCKVKNKSMHKEFSLHRFSFACMPFIILGFLLLVLAIATERIAISYFFPDTVSQSVLYLGREENKLGTILAYVIFPAVCEELFLRGLLQNRISDIAGGFTGILVSALAFALVHLDFKYFAVYFTSGLILAICAHVTNSVIPSMGLHILNNLFSLMFSARLSFIASERTGNAFLIIILVLFVFLILLFYLKSLEGLCMKKAYIEDAAKNDSLENSQRISYRKPFKMFSDSGYSYHKFLRVVFSPALIIAVILFLFITV